MIKHRFTIELLNRAKEIGDSYRQFGFAVVIEKPEIYLWFSFWHYNFYIGYMEKTVKH